MPTVEQVTAPYENHLVPVLAKDRGVCEVCHTFMADFTRNCRKCSEAKREFPATADAVAFVALAVKGEQLTREP